MKEKIGRDVWNILFYISLGIAMCVSFYCFWDLQRKVDGINQDLKKLDQCHEELYLLKSAK